MIDQDIIEIEKAKLKSEIAERNGHHLEDLERGSFIAYKQCKMCGHILSEIRTSRSIEDRDLYLYNKKAASLIIHHCKPGMQGYMEIIGVTYNTKVE